MVSQLEQVTSFYFSFNFDPLVIILFFSSSSLFVRYYNYTPTFVFFFIAMIRNAHDTIDASNFKYLNLEVVWDDYTKKKRSCLG